MMGLWSESHAQTIDPDRFRAHHQYLDQDGFDAVGVARWMRRSGMLDYFATLTEDDAFGCEVRELDGLTVSRDLVDSIMEIHFLEHAMGLQFDWTGVRILDIGAGYGRFAHRFTTRHPGAIVYCTDPIDISRQLCAKYLTHRRVRQALVVDPSKLNEVVAPDLAVNIHCWSECTADEVRWWLEWLDSREVPRLFIVPHNARLGVWDPHLGGGNGPSYRPMLLEFGWELLGDSYLGPPMHPRNYYLWGKP
jgi:SAM-dependent methyltransferase